MTELPALLQPPTSDFSARLTRAAGARPLRRAAATRHIGRRLAVLVAAIAVPAVAQSHYAPSDWGSAPAAPPAPVPMAFETPGESFPGSAFYYLADQPYLAPATAAPRLAGEAGLALPTGSVDRLGSDPVARSLITSGSLGDRARALRCMTLAIYYEAATEPAAGQRAVAQVVLNRVAHPSYPDTVCGVVFQGSERTTGCQFSFTCDGAMARAPAHMWWDRAEQVARAALAGAVYAPVGLATHYHTVQIHPYWADSLQTVGTIGAHVFYRWRGAAGNPAAFADRYLGAEPIAAPHPRTARPATNPWDSDPVALARVYEAGLATPASTALPTPVLRTAPNYAADISARGGDDLFRATVAPAAGQVRAEYARSGQWLKQP